MHHDFNRRRDRSIALVVLLAAAAPASAATFAVSSAADNGPGSLRQAITDANAAGGSNTVTFAISGAGPHTITLASALPGIGGSLVIDGYSQPGSVMNTHTPEQGGLDTQLMVELVGNGGVGFWLQANASLTLQGLALHGFGDAIAGNGGGPDASQLRVYGNFIGTALDGTALPGNGNGASGVRCGFTSAQIGGTQAWQRNLLSGNGGAGVLVGGPAVIEGNLIGTDASGTSAIPNGIAANWGGIVLGSRTDVRIGGSDPASRNVISGNRPLGIAIWASFGASGAPTGFEIKGNYIGTDWSGTRPVPNGFEAPNAAQYGGGIQIQNGTSNPTAIPIGGYAQGEANLIAYNRGAGIFASSNSAGEAFDSRANAIHHNRGVGHANLDIGAFGPTPNDLDDADGGANGQQNWPEIIASSQIGNQLSVTYRVDTALANASYPLRVDFYADVRGGSGEWLTQDTYPQASAQQQRTITLLVPAGARAIPFVATATDAGGHTSEFSPAFDVIFEDDFD